MAFSPFLESRRENAKALIAALQPHFDFVSLLGSDIQSKSVQATTRTSSIRSGNDTECGFVLKMHRGGAFFEYSLDDISGDPQALAQLILDAYQEGTEGFENTISGVCLEDEPLVRSFARETDRDSYTDREILEFCQAQRGKLQEKNENILNAFVSLSTRCVSQLFVSVHRELDQHYMWVNGYMGVVYRENNKVVETHELSCSHLIENVMRELPTLCDKLLDKAHHLTLAKPIVPGVYDVITAPSITGLIAHEAFGHGVEMDQFVKDRALAKEYVGKYVASPICNMRDGAASTLSAASYFFDDDGVLAGDTQIIKDGILVTGISDLVSASQLGTVPTGNGRRESTRRKAYSRMTNTFFEAGHDKLEDMIASIGHGYMLFETNNGMEDPKNWAIQCVAEYGIEIVDGKLTDNYVSPVVMSGYVPDLLKSISMISDECTIIGAGGCGKGYKEWVRVSDGGPALKARVKLG